MLQKLQKLAINHIPIYRDVTARKKYDAIVSDIRAETATFDDSRSVVIKKIVDNLVVRGSVKEILKNWIFRSDYSGMIPSQTAETQIRCVFNISKQLTSSLTKMVGIQVMDGPDSLVYRLTAKSDTSENAGVQEAANHIKFDMVSTAVQAKTYKLTAGWVTEDAEALLVAHGLDMATEIAAIVSQQVSQEITNIVLSDLRKLAKFRSEVSEAEVIEKLFEMSSDIANSSRRGFANFAVVSMDTLESVYPAIIPVTRANTDGIVGLHHVGIINRGCSSINVYLDDFAPADVILTGYKGAGGFDAGYVLSPYQVFNVGPAVASPPDVTQSHISTFTRFGTTEYNTYGNYYGVIQVKKDEH